MQNIVVVVTITYIGMRLRSQHILNQDLLLKCKKMTSCFYQHAVRTFKPHLTFILFVDDVQNHLRTMLLNDDFCLPELYFSPYVFCIMQISVGLYLFKLANR